MSSEVQHSYQLRSSIPRPRSAFMLFAEEKRRSVADENPNENNQRVSSRLRKLWRSLSGGVKEPYQRKVAEAAIVHRRNHPDYVYNPREAHRHKAQERRARRLLASPRMAVPGTRSSSRAFPQPWPKIEVSRSSSIHHHHRRKGTNAVGPALPVAAVRVSSTLLNDEDDDSTAGTSSFYQSGFLGSLGSAGGAPGEDQPS
ncbi:hypothetical protein HPB49_011661 [Dermacentor silvarum]|uniref:Uncharacterized protein n=1 Tax=Dermacentor silvarum TaxID=543639 RepID=A0ACB8DZS9_DERSI|nr:hypothetical protein HPB49_011661 [Dermacentor silvarum]